MHKRTPLFETHVAMGARMVEFGGWEMPVQYHGIIEEHRAVREQAGLFDISHMGRFMVRGSQAEDFLQQMLTCNVAAIPFGQASYGLLCQPDGGVVDDVFVYHLLDEFLVVVNAANRDKDWAWLNQHSSGFDVELEDRSERWAMLALQGPQAQSLLAHAPDSTTSDLAHLPFHSVALTTIFGFTALIARTGYTGEDGFELFFEAHHAADVWNGLLALGQPGSVQPCGLGARDSLRFEACLPLYGHELSPHINPYEARLGWVVKLDTGDFIGRDALVAIKAQGPARRLAGFELLARGVARSDYPVHNLNGMPVGHVTSGMPTPTLGKPLGIALVPSTLSAEGSEFDVIIREQPVRARVLKMPFYKPRYKKL
ncbi:glycine cleavage system aminomethyltransferase GcvT [Candidatus Viridilinea mediisalina]|uniref:Aminomethyltransferase n=1 Tax=Candidatus Viridilinea mediisalina TaxID=2024553 RepID=A0A2A6RN34_9CHLR|nr:glycine cleavage system aminomethyltransferase GcvT [Candidatus Viridilinea mediisalina]PDW04472.1 glycine cleavage system protein T [Candidatus Viridilinea mediisalina]